MSNKYLDLNGLKYYDNKLRTGATKVGKAALADTATKANGVNWGSAGVIPLANIPQGALERVVVVADDTARFKLTTGQAQLGDTIKVTSTGRMYIVVDESKKNSADGYMEYSAGKAATADSATEAGHAAKADQVPWSGVTGKPSTYAPSAHTHPSSNVTNVDALPTQNGNRAATGKSLNQNLSNLNKGLDDLNGAKADKATTLAGYGITDAFTKNETLQIGQQARDAILHDCEYTPSALDAIADTWLGLAADKRPAIYRLMSDGKVAGYLQMWECYQGRFLMQRVIVNCNNAQIVGISSVENKGMGFPNLSDDGLFTTQAGSTGPSHRDGFSSVYKRMKNISNTTSNEVPWATYDGQGFSSGQIAAGKWTCWHAEAIEFIRLYDALYKHDTLAGYGITDAYTKGEADTKHTALQDSINTKATKATTLNGYGIGDAYTKTEIDTKLSGVQASMVAITNSEIDTICNS